MRAARGRSNKAIATHDLDGIASVWMETIHATSSTSALTTGRDANRQRMAAQFKIGGTYSAQWRKVDGRWLIQSELYVPSHCSGSQYCKQRP